VTCLRVRGKTGGGGDGLLHGPSSNQPATTRAESRPPLPASSKSSNSSNTAHMARVAGVGGPDSSANPDGSLLDEATRWRLAEESGVLGKLAAAASSGPPTGARAGAAGAAGAAEAGTTTRGEDPSLLEWLVDTACMTAVFAVVHTTMLYLVHHQFGMTTHLTVGEVAQSLGSALPALVVVVGVTGHPVWTRSRLAHAIMALGATAAGCRVIALSTSPSESFGSMMQAPGLAVLWIYLILKADLLPACLSLAGTLLFYHRAPLLALLGPSPHDLGAEL
jgi:hypothetical protein